MESDKNLYKRKLYWTGSKTQVQELILSNIIYWNIITCPTCASDNLFSVGQNKPCYSDSILHNHAGSF